MKAAVLRGGGASIRRYNRLDPNKFVAALNNIVRIQVRRSGRMSRMLSPSMLSFLNRLAVKSCAYP